MTMKVKAPSGKEYFYDYIQLLVKKDTHSQLKNLAKNRGMTVVDLLEKIVKQYDD
jgi:hypothetical protein